MQKDWEAGVLAHDKSVEHILKLADLLSAGLIRQYPRRFAVR